MAGLAVVAATLAGCSEPEQPSTTLPTAASTSAAEATLEPLGPADFPVPDEARVQTEAGAEAMAIYYLNLLDHLKAQVGSSPTDTGPLRSLTDGCETCDQVADGFDNASASGYVYQGGDLDDPVFGTVSISLPTADLAFTVQQSAARVVASDGSEVRSTPETRLRGGIVFEWESVRSAWIATQLNLTA